LDLKFDQNAINVGIATALLLPLISMVGPLSRASAVELRDALDTYRRKTDNVAV